MIFRGTLKANPEGFEIMGQPMAIFPTVNEAGTLCGALSMWRETKSGAFIIPWRPYPKWNREVAAETASRLSDALSGQGLTHSIHTDTAGELIQTIVLSEEGARVVCETLIPQPFQPNW